MPALPRTQYVILAVMILILAAAQIDQPYPDMAWMQHIPTLLLILPAPWLLARWPLSTTSVALLAAFLALHTLGGRYIYSYVPYDHWMDAIFGTGLSEAMDWNRNHYDRLVHFAFGLLLVPPLAEWLQIHRARTRASALISAIGFILALSALYEIFEWLLTLVMGGNAERYNGQQGDFWDAQKDMALACAGAVVAASAASVRDAVRKRA